MSLEGDYLKGYMGNGYVSGSPSYKQGEADAKRDRERPVGGGDTEPLRIADDPCRGACDWQSELKVPEDRREQWLIEAEWIRFMEKEKRWWVDNRPELSSSADLVIEEMIEIITNARTGLYFNSDSFTNLKSTIDWCVEWGHRDLVLRRLNQLKNECRARPRVLEVLIDYVYDRYGPHVSPPTQFIGSA